MSTKALRESLRERDIEPGNLEDEKEAVAVFLWLANNEGLGWNIDYDAIEKPCYSVTLTVYDEGWLEKTSEDLGEAIREAMVAYFEGEELNPKEHHYYEKP